MCPWAGHSYHSERERRWTGKDIGSRGDNRVGTGLPSLCQILTGHYDIALKEMSPKALLVSVSVSLSPSRSLFLFFSLSLLPFSLPDSISPSLLSLSRSLSPHQFCEHSCVPVHRLSARPDDIMDTNHVRRSQSAERLPTYRYPANAHGVPQYFYSR